MTTCRLSTVYKSFSGWIGRFFLQHSYKSVHFRNRRAVFCWKHVAANGLPWVPLTFFKKTSSGAHFFVVRHYARSGFAFTEKATKLISFDARQAKRAIDALRELCSTCSGALPLDAYRSKCVFCVVRCTLARRLSIQVRILCARIRFRSTPDD